MNSAANRNKFLDRFRSQLPEIFYTNVPLPSFMETPLSDLFFKNPVSGKRVPQSRAQTGIAVVEGPLAAGKETKYSIDGKDVEIDNGTWVVGNIEIGTLARAKGRMKAGILHVSQLVLLKK